MILQIENETFPRQAGKQLSGLGWSSRIPFKVAVPNPEPLKEGAGLTVVEKWERSNSWVCRGLGTRRAGHCQPFCSVETFKMEWDEM